MVNLLVQFRTKIDWSNFSDWNFNTDSFAFSENYDGIGILSKIPGNGKVISKQIFDIGKRYRISFTLVDNINNKSGGRFRIKFNNTYSPYYKSRKSYSLVTDEITNRLFTIESEFSTNETLTATSQWGLKDLIIEEVGYSELDLATNTNIALNFSVADVRNYELRNGTYSKSITIPGTPKNNIFFNHVFNINQDNRFNINYKCPATLQFSETSFIDGNIQLDEIIKNGDSIFYNILFYGNNLNLFKDIGETLISDLYCPELEHTATITNIEKSWDNEKPYFYPLIDYGKKPNGALNGMIGTAIDKSPSVGLTVNDLYPGVSVKYLVDKIFEKYNYTYESEIFNSDNFKKLIIPFINEEDVLYSEHLVSDISFGGVSSISKYCSSNFIMNNMDNVLMPDGKYKITSNEMEASKDGIPGAALFVGNYSYMIENKDLYRSVNRERGMGLNYNPMTNPNSYQQQLPSIPGSYYVNKPGKYKIEMEFKLTGNYGNGGVFVIAGKINKNDITSNQYDRWKPIDIDAEEVKVIFCPLTGINLWRATNGYKTVSHTFENCKEGDMLYFKFYNYVAGANGFTGYVNNIKVYNVGWGEGCEVKPSMILPQDFKIKDFLKSLILMYNLYIDIDPTESTNLIIETRDKYYSQGQTVDWTYKLDIGQDISYIPPREFQSFKNNLTYSKGDDYWNKRYDDTRDFDSVGYGGKQRIIESDFNTGVNNVSIKFKPTMLRDEWTATGPNNLTQFVTSSLIDANHPFEQYLIPKFRTNWGPRILIFKKTNIFDNESNTRKFRLAGKDYSYYPYAGHISEPFNLTSETCFDINFETTKFNRVWTKFFSGFPNDRITQNNLFNNYYREYFYDISDKDSRIMTGYFKLDPSDISKMRLNDTILVNGTYFTINNVIDYDPSGKSLTKVELFKKSSTPIPELIPDKPVTGDVNINILPQATMDSFINIGKENISKGRNNILLGDNNTSNGSNSLISGTFINSTKDSTILSSNRITSNEKTLILKSKDIVIESGATNVVMIGTSNLKVKPLDKNTVFIEDLKIKSGIITSSNGLIDCGLIEIDGVYNPYKRIDYMIEDSGANGTKITDINSWVMVDGGII